MTSKKVDLFNPSMLNTSVWKKTVNYNKNTVLTTFAFTRLHEMDFNHLIHHLPAISAMPTTTPPWVSP